MDQSKFDTFGMFSDTPFWAISMPNKMCDYSWTRLAWCNRQKVAVYLAAMSIFEFGRPCLGVLILAPETCVWAYTVNFCELLTYFATIVRASGADFDFVEYATYAMAKFIDTSINETGGSPGELFGLLHVADPATDEYHDELANYQMIRGCLKESLLDDIGVLRYVRYANMMSCCYCEDTCVSTLERLTYEDLLSVKDGFLMDIPALGCVIRDYSKTFLKDVKIASEKLAKKPRRTTNVRELLWNSYPHICGLCGGQINSIDEMHVDHIIPLSRGGKDILANLQLTHARCNIDKGNTLFEDSEEECDT